MNSGVFKAQLMTADQMRRALTRMAHEMMEQLDPLDEVVLIGIRTRGLPLANRMAALLNTYAGVQPPVGEVDIAMYRDDLPGEEPRLRAERLPVPITGKTVVLVDDVLCTGRTVRAAMDALMDQGRPARIRLAVLIDRGHRELPIRPDYVGKNVPTSRLERIGVQVEEIDGTDDVTLYDLR